MKRLLCFLSSFVIAFSCLCFSVSAESFPKGFEKGECVFDDEDFKEYMSKYSDIYLDSDGFYYLSDSSSSSFRSLKNLTKDVVSPFYYVEYEVGQGGYIYLRYSTAIYPDPSIAPTATRSGAGSGFSVLSGGLYPQIRVSKKGDSDNYSVKSIRIYRVQQSGTAGIEKTGVAFGFMFNGINNVIGYVWSHPVLMLGIALFVCGCAIGIYFNLRN